MKKRIVSIILALLMTAPSLAACGESQINTENETSSESSAAVNENAVTETTGELSDYDKRQLIPDNLPAENFNGEEFRIMTGNATEYITELLPAALAPQPVDEARIAEVVALAHKTLSKE